ncbi:MAG: C25 family cysteine peptidase [Bacteroidota bacterium]
MKKVMLLSFLIAVVELLIAQSNFYTYNQDNTNAEFQPVRVIMDEGLNGIIIEYNFDGVFTNEVSVEGTTYTTLKIKDFSHLMEVGKPSLPSHNDIIAIPAGAKANIEIISYEVSEISNKLIYPTLEPASDRYGDKEPEFIIDEQFYSTNTLYPEEIAEINKINDYRGIPVAIIQVHPVQYNAKERKLFVYSNIKYKLSFTQSEEFFDKTIHSNNSLKIIPNYFLNGSSIKKEIEQYQANNHPRGINGPSKEYIIITHADYITAANTLAQWKRQLGYSVEVVSKPSWTYNDLEFEVHTRYQNWTPKPDYVVIIGDHNDVPGKMLVGPYGDYATDLYVSCMGGASDYYPDMAKGRISVTSAMQASNVVTKIIDYEKTPPSLASFYTTAVNCAYFQESATPGYAERRFAQTSEDIRDYVNGVLGYNVHRVYVTESTVTPTNWNNDLYSAGEPLPPYLLKPTFAWDGDYNDIINYTDAGAFYIFHRDHGFEDGWGDPYFTTANVNSLNNGALTPVVFSVNCLTGKFIETECFSEAFLRKENGGTVGIFGHAEVSYSGYNDGLSIGLVDAIWSSPGLVANFTGSGGVSSPTVTPHSDIFALGDVANQGLIRMVETWDDSQYTNELLHYFGDPAMKIWTAQPLSVTATHTTTLDCINDTSFTIFTSSLSDGLATLVIDGLLVGEVQLSGGYGIINFSGVQLYGTSAVVTISQHNYQPYIANIPITGNCINAGFTCSPGTTCIGGDDIVFTDVSSGSITTYIWDFGPNATPSTANTAGPHIVSYSTDGYHPVTLTIENALFTDVFTDSVFVNSICSFTMPVSGPQTLTVCSGYLYDDGGTGFYSANSDATTIISVPGTSHIDLNFILFDVEAGSGSTCDYDWIDIYDGPNSAYPLVGRYCNTNGSPGIFSSTGSSVTIVQHSDSGVELQGFEMSWQCVMSNTAPTPDFIASETNSCSATIDFTDLSINGPTTWLWYFGDGTTSNLQFPTHTYTTNGTYNVSLIVSNTFGSDSITKMSYISINAPVAPITTNNVRCDAGSLSLSANGTGIIEWYDAQVGGNYIGTGNVYNTPVISTTTTYYAENVALGSSYGGETNSSSSGDFYTAAAQHYLVFDCYTDITLASVEVNANATGNRTITLMDNTATVIDQITVNIPAGVSRIDLNFDIPAGTAYRLAGPLLPGLYRNDANCSYPYAVGSDVSINYSSATSNPTGYYYYFYDWEVISGLCSSSRVPAQANIIMPASINISAGGSTSFCNGDSVILTAPSGATSYLWYPGGETTQSISATSAGSYYIDFIIDSCSAQSNQIAVSIVNNQPVADFSFVSNDPTIDFNNLSLYAVSYYWDFGDGTNSTQTSPSHTYTANGTYNLMLIATNACGNDTMYTSISITSVGIAEMNISSLNIYPNPASSKLNIEFISKKSDSIILKLYNNIGQIIWMDKLPDFEGNYKHTIDINHLVAGIYAISIQSDKSLNIYLPVLINDF